MKGKRAAVCMLLSVGITAFFAACSPQSINQESGGGQTQTAGNDTNTPVGGMEGLGTAESATGRETGEEPASALEESVKPLEESVKPLEDSAEPLETNEGAGTDDGQTAYRAEFYTVNWDIDSYEAFFINRDQTGLVANRTPQDGTSASHWLKLISPDVEETEIPLAVAQNHVIREAGMNEDGIYTLSAAIPTADSPGGYWLTGMEADGTLRFSVSLDELTEGESPYYKNLVLDSEGTVWLMEYGSRTVFGFLRDGSQAVRHSAPELGGLVWDRDGRLYGTGTDPEEEKLVLYPVTKEGIGEPLSIEAYGIKGIYPGIEGDFLLQTGEKLKEYSIETETLTEICDLVNPGIDRINVRKASGTGSDRAVMVVSEPMSAACELVTLIKGNDADQETPQITIAALTADFVLREQIRLFNRSEQGFRVVLKEYYDETSPDMTKEDALTRLNADLVDGTAGDLLDFAGLDGTAVRASYVQKGIVENLYPWMEQDEEFQKEEYLQSLFTANEIDGKLYNLVPYFDVTTLIGRASQVGNGVCWDMEQMEKLLSPGMAMTDRYGREDFLYEYCLYYLQGEDISTALGDPSFASALELAKTFPEEATDSDLLGLSRNQVLLYAADFGGNLNGITFARAVLGDDISLIGFPVNGGVGSSFSNKVSLGLCSASPNKQEAWEFLKTLMSDSYQGMDGNAEFRNTVLPAENAAREEKYRYLQGLTDQGSFGITDENGESVWWTIPTVTQADTERAEALMNQITTVRELDPMIWQIIWEEANQYFADRCSAQQAAQNMQGRVSLYRMENGG